MRVGGQSYQQTRQQVVHVYVDYAAGSTRVALTIVVSCGMCMSTLCTLLQVANSDLIC